MVPSWTPVEPSGGFVRGLEVGSPGVQVDQNGALSNPVMGLVGFEVVLWWCGLEVVLRYPSAQESTPAGPSTGLVLVLRYPSVPELTPVEPSNGFGWI